MKTSVLTILTFTLLLSSCHAQSTKSKGLLGGPCEDCEAALDYKILNFEPGPSATIVGHDVFHPKLNISGTVFHQDGRTPAPNVILYIYQTNKGGIYEPSNDPIGWERRHGQYRTWVKTDAKGQYSFDSFRPGAYPNGIEPEHIHIYIIEPNKIPYYIDVVMFNDDPTLSQKDIDDQKFRGGSGLISLHEKGGSFSGQRDIILGHNIPNY